MRALLGYLRNAITLVVVVALDPDNTSLEMLCEQLQNGSSVNLAIYHLHMNHSV